MIKLLVLTLLATSTAWSADNPSFDDISEADFKTIAKEFSGMFVHTSATPPTSLGKVFGIEAAAIVGASEIPGIEAISKRQDPSLDMPYAPFAFLYAAVSVPYGITIETNFLPQVDINDLELSHYGAAVKWSLVDSLFPNLPFDIAVKTFFSKSEINFTQTIPSPSTRVDVGFENNMYGIETVFGLTLPLVQPYAGIGYVTSRADLNGVAQTDPTYSLFVDNTSRSKTTTVNGARVIVGCQFNLAMLKMTLEYNRLFDNNRLAAKVGFAF